jgi:hypothetical protein
MTVDNPLGDLVRGLRKNMDEYLAVVLQQAVGESIITDDQRNRIIELADRDPTGR